MQSSSTAPLTMTSVTFTQFSQQKLNIINFVKVEFTYCDILTMQKLIKGPKNLFVIGSCMNIQFSTKVRSAFVSVFVFSSVLSHWVTVGNDSRVGRQLIGCVCCQPTVSQMTAHHTVLASLRLLYSLITARIFIFLINL